MNTVLPIAQCWLPGEAEEDFTWALTKLQQLMVATEVGQPSVVIADRDQACMNAIGHLFPEVSSLVCRWHMNRNDLAKTRTVGQVEIVNPVLSQDKYENTVATDYFMELFYIAVDSSTETAFEENLVKIRSKSVELADYLDLHRWKYKEKLVTCRSSQYLNFGYRDTSAVEGTHSKCKAWLETSRGDLYKAFKKLLP
ncbi:hypothetical protein PC114_g27301 [Phytophthora cactorum]|nr:hypothetical protein PC114_g27301 [Phytophthora cactorum]